MIVHRREFDMYLLFSPLRSDTFPNLSRFVVNPKLMPWEPPVTIDLAGWGKMGEYWDKTCVQVLG